VSLPLRPALAAGLSVAFLLAGVASATDAPKTSAKSATFFLRQEGCGTTAEAGRLEPKDSGDGATGCGAIGGVPIGEAEAQTGSTAADGDTYSTIGKGLPIKLDASKKVTGQLAAESWIGSGAGAGTVSFDVALAGIDKAGKSFDFGTTTVSGSIAPGENVILVPFELAVPAGAGRAPMKSFTLSVLQHGMNLGFSAKHLDGDAYVVFPTKK
jgi:hypothetical protein